MQGTARGLQRDPPRLSAHPLTPLVLPHAFRRCGVHGTTVTGRRPAFTSRTAIDPTNRWPACSEAPTTTASALRSSAAFTMPLYGAPRKVWNSQRKSKPPDLLGRLPDLPHQVLGDLVRGLRHWRPERRARRRHRPHVHDGEQGVLPPGRTGGVGRPPAGRCRSRPLRPRSPSDRPCPVRTVPSAPPSRRRGCRTPVRRWHWAERVETSRRTGVAEVTRRRAGD